MNHFDSNSKQPFSMARSRAHFDNKSSAPRSCLEACDLLNSGSVPLRYMLRIKPYKPFTPFRGRQIGRKHPASQRESSSLPASSIATRRDSNKRELVQSFLASIRDRPGEPRIREEADSDASL